MSMITDLGLVRCTIEFDNGLTYVVETNGEDRSIKSLSVSEDEAITSGNIAGILSTGRINIGIVDISNALIPTNRNSPFYGFMRNGVKITLEEKDGVGEYRPYGTFYTNGWESDYYMGVSKMATIQAHNIMYYYANRNIPVLPLYNNIKIKTLFELILKSIGIESFVYDDELDMNLKFSVTAGSKIRDTLNDMLQALSARLVVGRDNVIYIYKSTESYGNYYTAEELGNNYITDVISSHNDNNVYNEVEIIFSDNGTNSLDRLFTSSNVKITKGLNKFTSLSFYNKAITIDSISVEHPASIKLENVIHDIDIEVTNNYLGGQNSIDIEIMNNSGVDVEGCNIIILGKSIQKNNNRGRASLTNETADIKVSEVLTLTSEIIQTKEEADKAAKKIAESINKLSTIVEIDTRLNYKVTIGDLLEIIDYPDILDGVYKVISCYTTHGLDYSKRLTLVQGYVTDNILITEDYIFM